MEHYERLSDVLDGIQLTMKNLGYWSASTVSKEALSSQQPFCCDTMTFSQWLQFVLIAKLKMLINTKQALPILAKGHGISPMASETYKEKSDQLLLDLIGQLDSLLQQV